MRVDVRALGACSRLAERGAGRSADALADLTGADLSVEVTGTSLASGADLAETLADGEFVGASVGLSGGLEGESMLVFDADAADAVLSLLPGGAAMERSAVAELGNIALGGFLDGWANYLGRGIDMTPPRHVAASGGAVLPEGVDADDGVFLFESRLQAAAEDLTFTIYMLPSSDRFRDLLMGVDPRADDRPAAVAGDVDADADAGGPVIPYESLSTFSSLAERGSASAAADIGAMTGLDTTVDVSRLRFVPLADLPSEVGDEPCAGTVFELQGTPSGYLAILFDEPSAAAVASAMLPTDVDAPLGELAEGALCELGNVMTSGFIDGWANVLGTSIEHSPPEYVHDIGSAVMSPLVARLGRRQEYGFVIDATIETERTNAQCDVYALPDERALARALTGLPNE